MVRFACAVVATFQVSALAKTLVRRAGSAAQVQVTPDGFIVDGAQAPPLRDGDEHVPPTVSAVEVLADGQTSTPQGVRSGDDLPGGPDLKSGAVPEAYWTSGARLVSASYGPLAAEFVNAMRKIESYHAQVIYKAGQNKSAVPIKTELVALMANWKSELAKHSARFGPCSDEPLDMENCMTLTRCLIEPETGKSIAPHILTLVVELETEIRTIALKDFEIYFNEFSNKSDHPCESHGTPPMNDTELLEGASEQLSKAVAVVANVHSAASRTVRMLNHPHTSLLTLLQPAHIPGIWGDVCTSLGCEPQSWLDVMDALQGHSAELVRLGAPARAISMHVSSMRAAHRALQHASHLGQVQGLLTGGPLAKAVNTSVYDKQIKEAAGTVYAAIAILRRTDTANAGDLDGWWSCIGIGITSKKGYSMKFPTVGTWGLAGGISVENDGHTENLIKLTKTLSGQSVCWGSVLIEAGAVAGFTPGFAGFGVRLGAGFSFGVRASSCGLSLEVKASMAGTIVASDSSCAFGAKVATFNCVQSIGVGLTGFCCTIKIPSGEYYCR